MADVEQIKQAVRQADVRRKTLRKTDFDLTTGVSGSREKVASIQVNRPHAVRSGAPVDVAIMAYEEFSTDGTAGNTETFNLANDLVDSGATDQNLVLYENGAEVDPDSVSLSGDSFDYTDDGTNNTLGVYYAAGDQAQVEVQKKAPNGTTEQLWTGDIGLLHMRDHGKEPVTFQLDASYWQPFVPADWTLEVHVDAPYTARWAKDIDGNGSDETAKNALLGVPVRRSRNKIPGLARATRIDAAEK